MQVAAKAGSTVPVMLVLCRLQLICVSISLIGRSYFGQVSSSVLFADIKGMIRAKVCGRGLAGSHCLLRVLILPVAL